jgi:hypothetical protein
MRRLPRGLFAAGLCLLSTCAFAQERPSDAVAFALPRFRFWHRPPQPVVVPLPSLLDNPRRTSLTFMAGAAPVHVFGDQSDNGSDWFVGFAAPGADAQYFPVMKMVHVLGMGGSSDFTAAGQAFSAHVKANVAHKLQSRLVVERADGSTAGEWSARQISDASFAAGYQLGLGGREYRLLYFRNFNENSSGRFGGYNGRRTIVLMWREGGGFSAVSWYESAIPRDRVLFTTPEVVNAEGDKVPGALRLGLRVLPDGQLEITPPN